MLSRSRRVSIAAQTGVRLKWAMCGLSSPALGIGLGSAPGLGLGAGLGLAAGLASGLGPALGLQGWDQGEGQGQGSGWLGFRVRMVGVFSVHGLGLVRL